MQTFLPYSSFSRSAKCLDRQRLGKQRVECLQILRILTGEDKKSRWRNHPAVKMWEGYEGSLVVYGIAICDEWIGRGYKDTCKEKIIKLDIPNGNNNIPPFIGNRSFHDSHKSNLLRKYPEYYNDFNWNIPNDLSYIWEI